MVTQASPTVLCSAAEVTEDMPVRCDVGETSYAVFRLEGEYFVIDDRCSHGPGSLSQGYVEGGEIECPFHQGRFDIRTGCAVGTPCTEPVRTWPVRIIDGMVTVDPCEERICES
jgi:nitrite reductase/ring-hydroxylating ferredoxin subunit